MTDPLRLALGTLTALPVPPPGRVDRRVSGQAMLLAPAVGLGIGCWAALVGWLALTAGLAPLPAAALAVGAVALASRGLHLDGLADSVDALASGFDRERALSVMRRGDCGPAGAAAIALVLLLQAAALAQVLGAGRWGVLILPLAVAAGRLALPVACRRGMPPARPEGLGAAVAGSVPRWSAVAVCALLAAGVGVAAAVAVAVAEAPPAAAVATCAAVPAAVAVSALATRRAVRRFGGVTGDVLGAAVEAATTAALLTAAAGVG